MSKFVTELQTAHLRQQFANVTEMVVCNVVGLDSTQTYEIRKGLREKGIRVQVVKRTLARNVLRELGMTEIESVLTGSTAIAHGGTGIVELAKEITAWAKKLEKFEVRGGYVSGEVVDAAGVKQLSELPSREELLGRIARIIQTPGANLAALIGGPGGRLVSQVRSHEDKLKEAGGGADAAPAAEASAEAAPTA